MQGTSFVTRFARGKRALALCLAALLPLPACYRMTPLENGPVPGMRVVAALTSEGTERMADRIGPNIVRVEGETAAVQPAQLDLRMVRAWDRGGREYPWAREPVAFPREFVSWLQQRELDQRRSWLVAGAVTIAAVVLGRQFVKGVFGGGSDRDPTVPPQ
jgi:hypothetical protein